MSTSVGLIVLANENTPSHKTNTSLNCRHKALVSASESTQFGLFPPLKIIKNVSNIWQALFITFLCPYHSNSPNSKSSIQPQFLLDTEHCCLNTTLCSHFQGPHCFQFELLIWQQTSSLLQLHNELSLAEIFQCSQFNFIHNMNILLSILILTHNDLNIAVCIWCISLTLFCIHYCALESSTTFHHWMYPTCPSLPQFLK